jgi:hypothetical protein
VAGKPWEWADLMPPEAIRAKHWPYDIHIAIYEVLSKNLLMPDEERKWLLTSVSQLDRFFAIHNLGQKPLPNDHPALAEPLFRKLYSEDTPQEREYVLALDSKLGPTPDVRNKFAEIYDGLPPDSRDDEHCAALCTEGG